MAVRATAQWSLTYGLMLLGLKQAARHGNLDAQLLVDPAYLADPYPHYERLRESYPLAEGLRASATVHHDVCTRVLRGDDFGMPRPLELLPAPARAALKLVGAPALGPLEPPSMLGVDPPEHTRYRKLVSRVFTAKAVAALRERTTLIADELLDQLDGSAAHPTDLIADYASLLPVTVISEILGVPVCMREQILRWGDGAAAALDLGLSWAQFRRTNADLIALRDWFTGHVARLRAAPGEDLLSQLVA